MVSSGQASFSTSLSFKSRARKLPTDLGEKATKSRVSQPVAKLIPTGTGEAGWIKTPKTSRQIRQQGGDPFGFSSTRRTIAVGQVKVRCWCGSIKSELVVIGCFDLIEPCQYHIDRCADAVDIRQLSIKGVCVNGVTRANVARKAGGGMMRRRRRKGGLHCMTIATSYL
ncbi:hypothetical protein CKAN_00861100 [Cinnamomum micranthum f. kanehirae]|uniref:Uncharacterized protein n=1 Tax=Cinnamomum micranthum f. kanehirae TaxID=337451 RepID=A0A443NNG1_9MAGN|nr:hypothetical protein CKAN_00861100 [Cinnamomum micranthum f. kanehirae]